MRPEVLADLSGRARAEDRRREHYWTVRNDPTPRVLGVARFPEYDVEPCGNRNIGGMIRDETGTPMRDDKRRVENPEHKQGPLDHCPPGPEPFASN